MGRPLFLPLKGEHFDAFKAGTKEVEYRRAGPRWSPAQCFTGRRIILSRGYGRAHRLEGTIEGFSIRSWWDVDAWHRRALAACYGETRFDVACIRIRVLRREEGQHEEQQPEGRQGHAPAIPLRGAEQEAHDGEQQQDEVDAQREVHQG
jgi:hypothetical protein